MKKKASVIVGMFLVVVSMIVLMGVMHTYYETQVKYKNSIQSTATVMNASDLDLRQGTKNMKNKYRHYHVYVYKIYQRVDLQLEYEGAFYQKSIRILHLSGSRTQRPKSDDLLNRVQPYKAGDKVEVMFLLTNPQGFNTTSNYMETILTTKILVIAIAVISIAFSLGCLLTYVGFKKKK